MPGRCNKLLVAVLLAPVIGLGATGATAKEKKPPEPRPLVGVEEGVVGDHLHLQRLGARRHPLPDAAEADDPQGLALLLDAE